MTTISEGKRYRDREYETHGPIWRTEDPVYVWSDGELSWTEDGLWFPGRTSGLDLIAEVPDDTDTLRARAKTVAEG